MESFAAYIMTPTNLAIVVAVWSIIKAANRVLPKLAQHPIYVRIKPLLGIVLCSGAVWIPGATNGEIGTGSRIMLGIVLGALVGHAHKIMKQTGLGDDKRIPRK